MYLICAKMSRHFQSARNLLAATLRSFEDLPNLHDNWYSTQAPLCLVSSHDQLWWAKSWLPTSRLQARKRIYLSQKRTWNWANKAGKYNKECIKEPFFELWQRVVKKFLSKNQCCVTAVHVFKCDLGSFSQSLLMCFFCRLPQPTFWTVS